MPLRVCYVSPTYFAPESFIGGGERYAEELSRAMSDLAAVKLVSFGRSSLRERPKANYERVILRNWSSAPMVPFSPKLLAELRGADVIHCFQYYVLTTFLASLTGALQRSRVFVTDLGGGGWTPGFHLDQSRWITAHLPISRYAARCLPGRNDRHRVIYGGVDLSRFPMRPELQHDGSIVFLGRILPHKGIHFLIEGLPADVTLHVIGPTPDPAYVMRLHGMAAGKRVEFHEGLSDAEVLPYLQRAMALVHPTPVDEHGSAGASELLGLAVIEAMACGCPAIVSDAASLPEIVDHMTSGVLVPPGSSDAIAAVVRELRTNSSLWRRLARRAREEVVSRFTWRDVAEQCLSIYTSGEPVSSTSRRRQPWGRHDEGSGNRLLRCLPTVR
jgi:glycosyltransferase involved in cell wall biosynthesis